MPASLVRRRSVRGLGAGLVATVLVAAVAPAASAHVTVSPGVVAQGGYATVAFKVPDERDDANVTELAVQLPYEEHPLSSVSVQPKPGWDYEIDKTELDEPISAHGSELTEVVSQITWTAAEPDAAIAPGEFDTFNVSMGRLPTDTEEMVFKAIQTYDGGEEVAWIEQAAEGSAEEPEHPAPVLHLAAVPEDFSGGEVAALALGTVPSAGSASAGATSGTGGDSTGGTAADTGAADTGAADTGAADTGAADTGAADTGAADTGAMNMGAMDMSPASEDSVNLALGLSGLGLFVGLLAGTVGGLAFARVRRNEAPRQERH